MNAKTSNKQVWITDSVQAGQINLCGEFNFDTVADIYAQVLPRVQQGQITSIDLSKITASNSAGLGLLLSLLKAAKQRGHALTFVNLPEALLAIAAVTGVSHLLLTV